MKREWISEGRSKSVVLGTIQGLTSEVTLIADAINRHRPSALGITATASEISGMMQWNGEEPDELSEFDIFYMKQLSRFGEVRMPSPSNLFAIQFSKKSGIPVHPLDMDEETYTERYMKYISPYSLFLDAIVRGRRYRRKIEGSPEEVVIRMDRLAQHPAGIGRLDREREETMAKNIIKHTGNYSSFLAIVSLERLDGVLEALRRQGVSFR